MAGHGGSIGPDLLILPGTVITQRAEQTACAGSLCWTPTKGGRRRDLSTPGSPLATPTSPALRQKSNKSKRWDGDRLAGGDGDGGLPPQQHPQHLGDGQPSWISEAMQSTGAIPLPGRGNKPLLPLGTDTGCVCSQAERRGVRDASSPSTLRSQPVNGEFHGCGTAERGREHAGAICSQDLRLSSRPDLGKANNLQEQMSHPPFPPGLWVYHALGSAPPQTPGALGWSLAPSWGHNQRAKLQRPGNLTAGVTPPKCGIFGNLGMAQWQRGFLLPPGTLGTTLRCHLTGCHPLFPLARIWRAHRAFTLQLPLPWQQRTKVPGSVTTRTSLGGKGAGAADPGRIQAGFQQVPGSGSHRCLSD